MTEHEHKFQLIDKKTPYQDKEMVKGNFITEYIILCTKCGFIDIKKNWTKSK